MKNILLITFGFLSFNASASQASDLMKKAYMESLLVKEFVATQNAILGECETKIDTTPYKNWLQRAESDLSIVESVRTHFVEKGGEFMGKEVLSVFNSHLQTVDGKVDKTIVPFKSVGESKLESVCNKWVSSFSNDNSNYLKKVNNKISFVKNNQSTINSAIADKSNW